MRRERSWSTRFAVFVLVAIGHLGVIVLLVRGLVSEPRREPVADNSMTMILFPLTEPRTNARTSVAGHPRRRQVAPLQPPPVGVPPAPSAPASQISGKAIDWNLEMQRAADAMLQTPKTRVFGEHQKSGIDAPRAGPTGHYAGETYRDGFGDTYFWTSPTCYVLSPAQELGVPTAFAHTALTRFGCIPQGPPEGQLFKDLPEYKARHPQ